MSDEDCCKMVQKESLMLHLRAVLMEIRLQISISTTTDTTCFGIPFTLFSRLQSGISMGN